jgi:hypothetical protein
MSISRRRLHLPESGPYPAFLPITKPGRDENTQLNGVVWKSNVIEVSIPSLSPSTRNDDEGYSSPNQPGRKRHIGRRSRFFNNNYFVPQLRLMLLGKQLSSLIILLIFVIVLYIVISWYMFHSILIPPPAPLKLPVGRVDVPVPNAMEWPIIHIVNTRFMQEQGSLFTLGMARFHLFMTFCFPTMISQSSQHFFWIIKTDPEFTKSPVFDLMLQAVHNSVSRHNNSNIYLVASNNNYLIHPQTKGSWKDGTECLDLLQSKIYTGNITKLHMAMALRNERPVVETRLDADDGLHMHYLKYIQLIALKRFQPAVYRAIQRHRQSHRTDLDDDNTQQENSPELVPQWLYWCARRHLEWHSSLDKTNHTTSSNNSSIGVLAPIQHDKLCVTPGMTVGYNIGVDPAHVPFHSHDTLYRKTRQSSACYPTTVSKNHTHPTSAACLDLVEDIYFCALRSRTMTSAGMLNVGNIPAFRMNENVNDRLWQLLKERFNISQRRVQQTQEFLIQHRKAIAYENILGQCTKGHSCKDQAKVELQRIVDEENASAF